MPLASPDHKCFGALGACGFVLLVMLSCVAHAEGAVTTAWMRPGDVPVPPGAVVRLELDRAEYLIGESVELRFIIENTGSESFRANFGGDYRGATRHLRFEVTATDETGQVAEDPDHTHFHMGGLSSWLEVKPGQEAPPFTLLLPRYCRIVEPGRYTIRATHDFGWATDGLPRPAGEAVISFRIPTAQEAEQVVTDLERRARAAQGISEKSRVLGEFGFLQHPVYAEPLARRARAGLIEAFHGIGRIATPAVTEVLIELTRVDDPAIALEAAMTLNSRLPDPEFEEELSPRGAFRVHGLEERRALAAAAWDDRFSAAVRECGRSLLKGYQPREVSAGAFMVQAVGTSEDGYRVLLALDEALRSLAQPRQIPEHGGVQLPEPVPELLRTMTILRRRGFQLPDALGNEGAILAFLDGLTSEPPPRPGRWFEIAKAYAAKGRFPTREAVLRSIPDPVPPACAPLIESLLDDPDPGVVRAACEVAARSGFSRFVSILLDILAVERDPWLVEAAAGAAVQLGAGVETLEVWAGRLSDPKLYSVALDHLQVVVEDLSNGSSSWHQPSRQERIALRQLWRKFLSVHGDELRAGKRFKIGDPALWPELFGRVRSFQLSDGMRWPPNSGPEE